MCCNLALEGGVTWNIWSTTFGKVYLIIYRDIHNLEPGFLKNVCHWYDNPN